MKFFRCLFFAFTISVPLFAQNPSPAVQKLRKDIDQLVNQYFLDNTWWGITVQSIKNGETLYTLNAKKNLIPASNMKILTSVFALDQLGPDFQYTTRVYLQGSFENDTTFAGNVIIRGMGDPTISGRYQEKNNVTKILENWRDSLKARNIKIIKGNIIGDDNFFGDDVLGKNWEWDSESYWYSAQVSGLSFNDNCIDWYVTPGKNTTSPARIQIVPNTHYIHIDNRVETVGSEYQAEEVDLIRERASNRVRAIGKIAVGSPVKVGYVTVENPTLYTATVFKEILEQDSAIIVEGNPADIDSLSGFTYNPDHDSTITQVASYVSPKLNEMLKIVNKKSQNFFAEQLLRTVPAVLQKTGNADTALAMEKEFLDRIGLNVKKMVIADGSGYARTNQISPVNLVDVLKYIRLHKYWKTFYESLPVAGVDGTISYRMKGTAAEGNVRAKTGFLDNVRTISGFLRTADNEELVFSIMCNNFTVNKLDVEKVQDDILARLATFTRN